MSGAGRRLPRRLIQLLAGLFIFGTGIAFLLRSNLGTAPWDVLGQGVARHVPLSFGMITILVSLFVLLLWIPLKERYGLGTILNALLIGPSADVALLVIPEVQELWLRIVFVVLGVVIIGAASGLYLGARFGAGPRDGLMTGISRRTGWPIWIVRTTIEVIVLAIGWLLGGVVGVGTVLFAIGIGPLVQYFMRIFDVKPLEASAMSAVESDPSAGFLALDEDEDGADEPQRQLHEEC